MMITCNDCGSNKIKQKASMGNWFVLYPVNYNDPKLPFDITYRETSKKGALPIVWEPFFYCMKCQKKSEVSNE